MNNKIDTDHRPIVVVCTEVLAMAVSGNRFDRPSAGGAGCLPRI